MIWRGIKTITRLLGMLALVVIAVWAVTPPPETVPCEPQDPIRVSVGDTVFAIPAVFMPAFSWKDDVELERQSPLETHEDAFSQHGTPLRWWFCGTESGAPIEVTGFFIQRRWIEYAVENGDIDYEYLPSIDSIKVANGYIPLTSDQNPEAPGVFLGEVCSLLRATNSDFRAQIPKLPSRCVAFQTYTCHQKPYFS